MQHVEPNGIPHVTHHIELKAQVQAHPRRCASGKRTRGDAPACGRAGLEAPAKPQAGQQSACGALRHGTVIERNPRVVQRLAVVAHAQEEVLPAQVPCAHSTQGVMPGGQHAGNGRFRPS